jgi:hypothetical protein
VKGFCSELIRGIQPATCDVTLASEDCSKRERESSSKQRVVVGAASSAVVFDEREREEKIADFVVKREKYIYASVCAFVHVVIGRFVCIGNLFIRVL